MHEDLDFYRDDTEDGDAEASTSAAPRRGASPVATLARLALKEALSAANRRRLAERGSLALVVEVPSAAWVEPVRAACEHLSGWSRKFARAGGSRQEDRPDKGNDLVAAALGAGGRVLGVSPDGRRFLPAALFAAADLRVRIASPSNAVVARAIRAATGSRPASLPPGAAAGLDFWEVCAAIRVGSTAASCVERLAEAARSSATVDPTVAEAPDFLALRGYGEAHAWGRTLLLGLDAWRQGGAFPPDRAAVVAGDAGVGKTTYVRALAKAAGLPLVATSVAELFANSSGYLDGVIKQLEAAFAAASAQPSILFLDECDAIPDRRFLTDRAREWWNPFCVAALLGVEKLVSGRSSRTVVIGATNFPDKLDPALVRPGRLTRVIRIGLPTAADLAAILRQHLGADLPDADLAALGELALGATGAQAAGWVREARGAAQAARRPLSEADLRAAVAPADERSPATLRRHALHEAGHAVAVERLGTGRVDQVDVVARGEAGGSTKVAPRRGRAATRGELEDVVRAILAGRAAERVFLGAAAAGSGGGEGSDLDRATTLVAALHASLGLGRTLAYRGDMAEMGRLVREDAALRRVVEADLVRLQADAERLVAADRRLVESVADRLVARRVLPGEDLRALVATAAPPAAHPAGGGPPPAGDLPDEVGGCLA